MQMLIRHAFMAMPVIAAVFPMHMDMRVDMRMFVCMEQISMPVLMGVGMRMLMRMLQFDGVLNHKIGADDHQNQRNIESACRSFT